MLAKRKMSVTELADRVGITIANISVLKNGKAKAIRLSTLEAICKALECQPGDILEYKPTPEPIAAPQSQRRTDSHRPPARGIFDRSRERRLAGSSKSLRLSTLQTRPS